MKSQEAENPFKGLTESEEGIERFCSSLEEGDIKLNDLIEYGIFLYGKTKTGKTTLGHMLVGNPLIGIFYNGEMMLKPTIESNKHAVIGNEGHSETEIPNIFPTKLNSPEEGKKITVVDKPGHSDSRGILKMISNGYYHYRVYSKTRHAKFILCFERSHLTGTFENFSTNIRNFSESFKSYASEKQEIWKSCAFVVTKCDAGKDEETNVENIKVIVRQWIKNSQMASFQDEAADIKEFARFMVEDERIFAVKHYQKNEKPELSGLLARINLKVGAWWSRDLEGEGTVDMSRVRFSIGRAIMSGIIYENNRNQLCNLIDHLKGRYAKTFKRAAKQGGGCFDQAVKAFVADCMAKPESHDFLAHIKAFVQEEYPKLSNKKQLSQKREEFIKKKFGDGGSTTLNSQRSSKPYFIKKFEVLEKLEHIKKSICSIEARERQGVGLNEIQALFVNLFKELNFIRYSRENETDIFRFGYLVHRLFEQQKTFLLILQEKNPQAELNASSKDFIEQIQQYLGKSLDNLALKLKEYFEQEFHYDGEDYTFDSLKQKYFSDLDIGSLFGPASIESIETVRFVCGFQAQNNKDFKKIVRVVLEHSKTKTAANKFSEIKGNQKFLLEKLFSCREQLQEIAEEEFEEAEKQENIMLIRNVTKEIGKILHLQLRYKYSRQVYKTIRFVDTVMKLYRQQIDKDPSNIDLRLQFAQYASSHSRAADAIEILQKAFEIVDDYRQIGRIKELLLQIDQEKSQRSERYISQIFQEEYYENFKKGFSEKIIGSSNQFD